MTDGLWHGEPGVLQGTWGVLRAGPAAAGLDPKAELALAEYPHHLEARETTAVDIGGVSVERATAMMWEAGWHLEAACARQVAASSRLGVRV